MADPQAAQLTQLKNIQRKTGKTIAELCAAVLASGLAKHGERRSWLIEQFKLGYGDANTVIHFVGKPLPALDDTPPSAPAAEVAAAGDPLDSIYVGAKAPLRDLHERVMLRIESLGPHEKAPKKTYISLRRKKQFATIGPATRDLLELGLNAKGLAEHPRLKALAAGGMCNYTVRLGTADEIDDQLLAWVRSAYEAAG